MVGSPGNNASAPYGDLGGALIVNSSVTITMQSGSTVQGVLFYRKGMAFPATSSSAFAGTCLTNGGDDVAIFQCMFLGFDMAFSSVGIGAAGLNRIRIENVNMDCQNGIYIENCLDNPYLAFIHSWPFATIAASESNPTTWYQRTGVAYHFKDVADWLNVVSCFDYNHDVGFKLENVNSYVLDNAMCDGLSVFGISAGTWNAFTNNPPLASSTISPSSGNAYPYYTVSVAGTTNLNGIADWDVGEKAFFVNGAWTKVPVEVTPILNIATGSVGIEIDGTAGGCEYGQIVNCRIASKQEAAIKIETLPGVVTSILGGACWANNLVGVKLIEGDLSITDTGFTNSNVGIQVESATSKVKRDGVKFYNIGSPIKATVATTNIFGGGDFSNRGPGGSIIENNGNVTVATVASASAIGLPMNGETFLISGTTDFGTLGPGWKDREVTLIFEDALTVFTGTGANTAMRLDQNVNFNVLAGDTLTLKHDGEQWYEIGRSGQGLLTTPTLASADPLPLTATNDAFNITGTTNFGTVTGGLDGRDVTLFFAGVLTVFSGTANSDAVRLSGGSNFTTTAGATLTLRHNGTQWYEIGRSA